jgi:hypothetical protein
VNASKHAGQPREGVDIAAFPRGIKTGIKVPPDWDGGTTLSGHSEGRWSWGADLIVDGPRHLHTGCLFTGALQLWRDFAIELLLMQLAWHLRNRHLPTQVEGIPILNRADHVIAAMLRGLGATVEAVQAPSTPKVAPMVNTTAATITTTTMNTEHFARLLTWPSPAYPAGAYTYSHGIEAAVEDGAVRDAASLAAYIRTVLRDGAWRIDGALCAAALATEDVAAFDAIAELAFAWRGTAETALESTAQGSAFALVTRGCLAGCALRGVLRAAPEAARPCSRVWCRLPLRGDPSARRCSPTSPPPRRTSPRRACG